MTDYSSLLGGGGSGGGGGGDKATSSASSATSGQQFGSIFGPGDAAGGASTVGIVAGSGVFILGLVALVWAISHGK